MFAVFFDPPAFPGEVWISCEDEERVCAVVTSLGKLSIEVTDVERDGESLTIQEYNELLGQ